MVGPRRRRDLTAEPRPALPPPPSPRPRRQLETHPSPRRHLQFHKPDGTPFQLRRPAASMFSPHSQPRCLGRVGPLGPAAYMAPYPHLVDTVRYPHAGHHPRAHTAGDEGAHGGAVGSRAQPSTSSTLAHALTVNVDRLWSQKGYPGSRDARPASGDDLFGQAIDRGAVVVAGIDRRDGQTSRQPGPPDIDKRDRLALRFVHGIDRMFPATLETPRIASPVSATIPAESR